ncbi:Ubiquitin carboxyl-terminal hydrolase 36, partial [Gryllus bimaculatus]
MCILSCYFQRLVQFNDCKGIMPAKIGDPVSASLRQSLSASENSGDLDKRLVLSSSQVLNISVEYEETESYNASVLDNLKHKYVRIDTDKPIVNGGVPTQRSIENQANREMRPEPDSVLPTPKVILFPAERVQIGWRGNFPVGAGMINVGNTCYLNSTLQALFHIPALVNWLQSDSDHLNKCFVANGSMQGECINCAMSKTLKASQNKSGNVIKPYLIYNKLKMICKHMVHGQQEDAHEFMRYLIESMEETYLVRFKGEKLDNYSKETTPLNQIFGGYMRTEVNCLQCRGVSTTFQHFQDLLLDIRRASTLDDALASYFQRERLDGDDAYRCERCHKKVSATKKFSIEKPPFVLCIQLKRFSMVGGKINKHVSFTQRLDMTRFLCPQSAYRGSQPLTYRLVSMVTHMGTSVHCGHYTAIAQTSTGHFYQFDDSAVRPISLNAALETNAYIIIYELERIDARQTQNHSSSSKPATVTSGTSTPILACNGQKSNNNSGTFNCPLLPSNHKPGPSIIPSPPNMKINSGANTVTSKISPGIIPAVHKPSVGCHLPPAKERDRITFGLHPRLVMRIKNGTVCQPSTQENKPSSSLVPYDSEDSSESETEKNEKKPDMPSLEPSPERKVPTPNKQNLPLVKQSELFPVRSKSPSAGSPFLHKSGELSSSNKPLSSHEMHPKTSPSRTADSSQVQKAVKPPSSTSDSSPATCNKDTSQSSPVPLKSCSENSKNKKPEGSSGGSCKKLIDIESLNCVSTSVDEGDVEIIQTLQVNTKLPGNGNGKAASGGWQVTDMALHSPSCHSESSSTSVASSTTPWSVSDVKRSPKKTPRTTSDSVDNSNSSQSVTKQSASLCNYTSDNEGGQFHRSHSSSRANSVESLTNPTSRPQWEVSPSIPGVHHSRCPDKEENIPVIVRHGNSNCSPEKSSKDRKKIVECKYEPYHNGNHKSPKCGEESDEYEWVEKTRETINVNRSNGQINGWGHSSRSEVSCYLMKQSHQGYGPSVSSWNGGRSHIDREVENDRHDERKRSHSKYDEELDMGRVNRSTAVAKDVGKQ